MKRKSIKKIRESVLVYPFFAVLIFMLLVVLVIPARRHQEYGSSEYESYPLPELSISGIMDGSFVNGVDKWFSATFPGRSEWFRISDSIRNLYGLGENYVSTGMSFMSDILPEPAADTAETEPAEQTGSLAEEAETGAEETETPVKKPEAETAEPEATATAAPPSATPSEESATIITIKETSPEIVDASLYASVIRIGDSVYSTQGYSTEASLEYTELVNGFASECAAHGIKLYNIIAPTSIGINVSYDIRKNFGSVNQDELLEFLFSHQSADVECVNTFDTLSVHKNEYIYYRTDYPWTSLGAWYAYSDFCHCAGITAVRLSDCSRVSSGEYRGMLYYSVPRREKLKADEKISYVPPDDESEKKEQTCLVVKDAFGDALSEYLRYNYLNVYTADYREYEGSILNYAEKIGADDIILCQGIGVSQSGSATAMLKEILK